MVPNLTAFLLQAAAGTATLAAVLLWRRAERARRDAEAQLASLRHQLAASGSTAEEALQATLRQLRELSELQETAGAQERQRQAQTLHDGLGQSLLALKLDASMLASSSRARHPRLHAHAQRIQATLDQAIHTVRSLINELHPSILELGLPAATDWLLKQQERRSGIECRLHLISDGTVLAAPQTWGLFRIIQQALHSIQAHAQATRLDLSLDLRAGALLIVISDNGTAGWAAGSRRASLSVLALRERICAHGGQLSEDSTPGLGTTLTLKFPGNEKREAAASRPPSTVDA